MQVSEKWLRQYINPEISTETLVAQLTMAGLEVDGYEKAAYMFDNVFVGQIISLEKHPDADKLSICQVKVTDGAELLQIVCGASNARAGLKVAVAIEGAVLAGELKIKKSKLRGIESQGMLCAASELGMAENSVGLLELDQNAPLGADLRKYLDLDDVVIDVDLTPNRADCLSVRGLVREMGVLNNTRTLPFDVKQIAATIQDVIDVSLSSPEACPRYIGRVIRNINSKAKTPVWMVERLRRGGVRSIDPVVDVTNFVLLELGQPMHAFDLDKLSGAIDVRMAKQGEKLLLLDGQEIALRADTLVIADNKKALALAGVMGGKESAVSRETTHIFLECAFFAPLAVVGKARSYGLHTDSSHRFERGVDFELQVQAVERATALLLDIVAGDAGPVTEVFSQQYLPQTRTVQLRKARITAVLGFELDEDEIENMLTRLGMQLQRNAGAWQVQVPSWRFDISIEVDLIEEIARIYGYNKLPIAALNFPQGLLAASEMKLDKLVLLRLLADMGYQESICYSFIDKESQLLFDPDSELLALANPISAELAVMRSSLWPGLIKAAVFNQNRQQHGLRLFEHGLVFQKRNGQLLQKKMLAGLVSKTAEEIHWDPARKEVDFYDVKGDLENLISLGGLVRGCEFKPCQHRALHPGQSVAIYKHGDVAGYLGALHPEFANKLGLELDVFVFELDWELITEKTLPVYKPVSKFPATRRDLAFMLDKAISAQAVLQFISANGGEILQHVSVFDVYEGENIEKGNKSIALSLTFQHVSRTLEELEVTDLVDKIVRTLEQSFDAKLRD